jgi:hypothetical protein
MNFIDYDNLVSTLGREETDLFLLFPYLLDTTVGGTIYFMDINGITARDLHAMFTLVARNFCRPLLAIEGLGYQSGKGCFAHSPNTAENYGMGNTISVKGILKRPDNRLLPDNLLKCLWPPFSG